ncbi:MAG: prepilin-type N-terminal cleavage/methylation domain-containing protein [Polyangiales bacterium]
MRTTISRLRTASRGMSLVEHMIVVVILGVLAGVAGVSYSIYIKRSRAQEATTQLATIASREQAYRAEFSVYCSAGASSGSPPTSLGVTNAWPTTAPGQLTDFSSGVPAEWLQLGYRPLGNVRYRYVALAGQPSTTPPGVSNWSSSANQDLWYIVEAYGNLDNDSTLSTFRIFSGNGNTVQYTNEYE